MQDSDFIGCIRVSPPLNDDEMDFLRDLAESGRTLRSTPTGRGNTDVPFVRLAWQACDAAAACRGIAIARRRLDASLAALPGRPPVPSRGRG